MILRLPNIYILNPTGNWKSKLFLQKENQNKILIRNKTLVVRHELREQINDIVLEILEITSLN
jgi:hypothetical protein